MDAISLNSNVVPKNINVKSSNVGILETFPEGSDEYKASENIVKFEAPEKSTDETQLQVELSGSYHPLGCCYPLLQTWTGRHLQFITYFVKKVYLDGFVICFKTKEMHKLYLTCALCSRIFWRFLIRVHISFGCAFEYYMFWFAYYPIFRGSSENPTPHVMSRELEWFDYVYWVMGGPSAPERRSEDNLYMRLLGAYLRAYVPVGDRNAHIPLQRSLSHDTPAEFLVNALIQFWIVNNDFSPLPVELFKSFPLLSARDKTPPASGLGEVVNMFVMYYLNPRRKETGTAIIVQSSNMRFQRPLYRFISRTFLYCPMESIENASQVFTLWVSYLEPWTVYMGT